MPTDEEIGKKIVEAVWANEKYSSIFFTSLQKQLNRLNTRTTKEATKLYDKILSLLDLKDELVENSVDNLSKVSKLMLGIDKIQRVYRKEYGKIIKIARKESWELLKDREDKITKLLNKVNIVERSRTVMTGENKSLLKMLNQQGYKRINETLGKWKNFAYDMFYVGVTRGMSIEDFKSLFYTDVRTLKVGSSLPQEAEMETMISITEQRTAFLQQRAKELDYKYCWNSNPMDMRTKPECIGACLSGVITEAEMGSVHGFPPRHICRCELCYTRGEWKKINSGINGAIASRRLQLLDELKSAPNQMSAWMRLGKEVHVDPGKDALRAAGMKPYKEIEDKIKLIEGKKVPKFDIDILEEIPLWVPAKTIEELNEKMQKMKLGGFEFDKKYSAKDALNIGNQVAEHMHDQFVRFPKLRKILDEQQLFTIEVIKARTLPSITGGAAGRYVRSSFRIELAGSTRKVHSLAGFGKSNFAMNKDLFSITRHEFGHHIWSKAETTKFKALWKDKGKGYFEKYVTKYSGKKSEEAFCEVLSGYLSPLYGTTKGKTFPKELVEAIEEALF